MVFLIAGGIVVALFSVMSLYCALVISSDVDDWMEDHQD